MTLRAITFPQLENLVASVNGKTGEVVLSAADIPGAVRSVDTVTPNSNGNVTLPYASASTAGTVKVGSGLSISPTGVLSNTGVEPAGMVKSVNSLLPDSGGNVTVPIPTAATSAIAGIVKPGTGLSVSGDGTLTNTQIVPSNIVFSVNSTAPDANGNVVLSLPPPLAPATTTTLGGVIVGEHLLVSPTGVLSVSPGILPSDIVNTINGRTGDVVLGTDDIPGVVTTVQGVSPNAAGNVALPNASTVDFGLVRIGGGLSVSGGVISYTLPTATPTVKGGVSIGTGLSIDANGKVSLNYNPPVATASTTGVIRPGTGLSVDGSGTLTVTYSYTLPAATAAIRGGVTIGTGLSVVGDKVSINPATASVIGGVRPGTGLAVDSAGVLSVSGGATGTVTSVNNVEPDGTGNVQLGTAANAAVTDFATASQGTKADSAVQPSELVASVGLIDFNLTATYPPGSLGAVLQEFMLRVPNKTIN